MRWERVLGEMLRFCHPSGLCTGARGPDPARMWGPMGGEGALGGEAVDGSTPDEPGELVGLCRRPKHQQRQEEANKTSEVGQLDNSLAAAAAKRRREASRRPHRGCHC